MFEVIAFYLFAFLTIAMFGITILTKNVLYALSSLAAGMIFISAFFFLLNADFLGVVQIIVYTGAVMALYAFGMMFFDSISDIEENIENPRLAFFLTGSVALIVVCIFIAPVIGAKVQAFYPIHPEYGNIQNVGLILFTKYLVPFEVAAVMLLVAMIGGIILAGKKMDISITELDEINIDNHKTDIEILKDIK
ncbi:NADH-ubiquinone oxidoreductase chain J [hydrothermal vent metagenome]|uniref:NADH-ubiquinone oxidoreductase chain J n=1 Tax=hydrothermal vent metagenome TaxID=652676 RepID=A0A3B1DYG5_9ZZZZ